MDCGDVIPNLFVNNQVFFLSRSVWLLEKSNSNLGFEFLDDDSSEFSGY